MFFLTPSRARTSSRLALPATRAAALLGALWVTIGMPLEMTAPHAAQPSSAQPSSATPAPPLLVISAGEQASLGIQTAPVKPSAGRQILVSAAVVTPPGKEFTVSAPYAGQIARLLVGIGDFVKAGAPLAHFTSPLLGDARRLLAEAELDYKNASSAAQRDQALFDEGLIPAVRLQLSRSKQQAAQQQLRARQAELGAAGMRFDAAAGYATGTLFAPLSGVVLEASTAVGQRLEAGSSLFRLADTSQLQLNIQLSSEKALQLQMGDDVVIAARNAKARITGISPAVDPSQSAHARALVTQRGGLQVGEFVSATVQTKRVNPRNPAASEAADMQWLVPTRALTQWRGKSWIFIANSKGFSAHSVNVASSTDDLSFIEALPALTPSSKVAVMGVASLRALLQKGE